MKPETKQCQNCKKDFIIESEDFAFYDKIKVPPPTWCPECRMQRRLVWRNERTLFRRKCDAPGHGEDIISMYDAQTPFPVYCHLFWYGDGWDALKYGREYDPSRSFFDQFRELLHSVPHVALFDSKSVNSSYCNIVVELKDCYLVSAGWGNEDSMYSNRIAYCKDTCDSYICHRTDYGYGNVYCRESNKLYFSLMSEGCVNSYFLFDCKNCSDCVGCANLRNKQHCIFNEQYSKEEYDKKIKEMNLGSHRTLLDLKKKFDEMRLSAIHRYATLVNTQNVIGDNVFNSRDCDQCFDLDGDAENVKFSHWGTKGLRDSYDTGPGTGGNSELLYEGISIGVKNANCKFGVIVWYSHDAEYCYNCQDSRNLFGCVGLRNKEYCIMNKQYSKEEYERIREGIISDMSKRGEYGEFFPAEMSPYCYNDTVSQDYFALAESDAKEKGFNWRGLSARDYKVTMPADAVPDKIADTSDKVMNEIIGCAHAAECAHNCTSAFRIIPRELAYYRSMNLPIPKLCPNCRHGERLALRNPLKLWHRQCMCAVNSHGHGQKCPVEFETSYSPDRPEIVYCEKCYQQEVI
jgi:hypothetical protein